MDLEHRSRFGFLAAAGFALCTLLLLTASTGGATEPACVSRVRFELEPQASLPEGLQGKVILHPKDGKEPVTLAARVGTPVTTELPCGSQWEATPEFPNVWGPRRMVATGTAGGPVVSRLTLWPLGKITGGVKLAEKGQPLPKEITVTTLAPRSLSRRDTPKGSLDCPVDPAGHWSCPPLPATSFDLVLSAAGFIPQYRWDFAVHSGATTDMGMLVLKKGASVAGWVDVEGGAIDPNCRASLAPLVGPGSGSRIAEKVRRTTIETAVRKDGFFQIVGVAPGDYALEVHQPGFASTTVNPIAVSPRSETFLRQPITLKRPLDVELAISPPLDWLGRPWKVILFRASGDATGNFDQTILVGSADEQGNLKVAHQTPGSFMTRVSDSLDNPLASQRFQITGPENASQAIHLKILTLRGTVKLGKEPLAAELWFGGQRGSSSVKLDSDRDGKFQGILPRAGWWSVDIASASPKFETRTKVKVESDGQDKVRADIELPATRVFGKVVDDMGHPMPDATVSLSTDQDMVHKKTDETGSFDIRGLQEGLAYAGATLSSAQGNWSSDRISLFLHDGEDFGPVEVRMRKEAKLSGLVQSAQGPVPGAGVSVFPLRPSTIGGDSVRTDVDGTFTAQVPAPTELADVVVSAPGYALKAFPVAVGSDPAQAPQALLVEPQGGEVQILFPPPPEDPGKDTILLQVFQNGVPLPTGDLYGWARGHGAAPSETSGKGRKSLTVPELAPGEYRACLAAQSILVPWEASGWTAPLAKCATGTLTAGGALTLDLSGP